MCSHTRRLCVLHIELHVLPLTLYTGVWGVYVHPQGVCTHTGRLHMLSMLACIAAHDDVGCLDHPLLTTPHPLVLLPPHPTHPPGGPPGPGYPVYRVCGCTGGSMCIASYCTCGDHLEHPLRPCTHGMTSLTISYSQHHLVVDMHNHPLRRGTL